MARTIILDDSFVMSQLMSAASRCRPILVPSMDQWSRVDKNIESCRKILEKHHGLTKKSNPSRAFIAEWHLLNRGLAILGHRLHLYHALAMIKHTIEIDWMAHTELAKEKLMKLDEVNGLFDEKTTKALAKFQKARNLQATGFPDQATLWMLFESNS